MRRRTLLLLAAGLLGLAAQAALALRAADAIDPAAPAAHGPQLGPREVAAVVALGGFRVFITNAVWARMIDAWRDGDYLEVPALAAMLSTLDPQLEVAWGITGWTLAVQVPSTLDSDAAAWPWVRQGVLHLMEGIKRNPGSWRIRNELALLFRAHIEPRPERLERFMTDRAVNPEGALPAELARRLWIEAAARPGHPTYIDGMVIRATMDLAELARMHGRPDEAERLRDQARAVLDHIRRDHPDAAPELLELWTEVVEGA